MSTQYIRNVAVHYGDKDIDQPVDAIQEVEGKNNDINAGFGGKFVWLVPEFTDKASEAATAFVIYIEKDPVPGRDDLAKGAGGDFRYIVQQADPQNNQKIHKVELLRSDSGVAGPPEGYNGITIDFNKGRGKSFLYVIWKTVKA